MGCDIHLYAEIRDGNRWVSADTWEVNPEYPEEGPGVDYGLRLYRGRNYNLFAILADVRNGKGFAGTKTGEGFIPIADPRGLPHDVCEQIHAESEGWGVDGHSHSYFTLAELLAYDWTQTSDLQGWTEADDYEEWLRFRGFSGGGPKGYCGDVTGRDIRKVTHDEMAAYLAERKAGKPVPDGQFYTLAKWTETYYEAAGEFWQSTMPRLAKLAHDAGGFDNARIVFFFDN